MTGTALLHQEAQATLQAEAQAVTAVADIAEEPAGVPVATAAGAHPEAVAAQAREDNKYD